MADRGHRVREALHLVKVLGRRQVFLLQRLELVTNVADASPALRREHGMNRSPHLGCRVAADHLADDVLRHRGEQHAKNTLILLPPSLVGRVRNLYDGIAGSLGDRTGWCSSSPVEVAMEILAGEIG